MIIETIHAKVGTHAAGYYNVKAYDGSPLRAIAVGDRVLVQSDSDYRCCRWTGGIVDESRNIGNANPLYFIQLH